MVLMTSSIPSKPKEEELSKGYVALDKEGKGYFVDLEKKRRLEAEKNKPKEDKVEPQKEEKDSKKKSKKK